MITGDQGGAVAGRGLVPAGPLGPRATPWRQRCDLAEALGCEMTEHDTARTGRHEASTVPGLYLAGDIAGGYQLAIVAAAQGATAAVAVNTELIRDGLRD